MNANPIIFEELEGRNISHQCFGGKAEQSLAFWPDMPDKARTTQVQRMSACTAWALFGMNGMMLGHRN